MSLASWDGDPGQVFLEVPAALAQGGRGKRPAAGTGLRAVEAPGSLPTRPTPPPQIFCSRCSSHSAPLPRYGQVKPVRVCTHCYVFHVTPFYSDRAAI